MPPNEFWQLHVEGIEQGGLGGVVTILALLDAASETSEGVSGNPPAGSRRHG